MELLDWIRGRLVFLFLVRVHNVDEERGLFMPKIIEIVIGKKFLLVLRIDRL